MATRRTPPRMLPTITPVFWRLVSVGVATGSGVAVVVEVTVGAVVEEGVVVR